MKNLNNQFEGLDFGDKPLPENLKELIRLELPEDLIGVYSENDGLEGFLNNNYFVLYSIEELLEINFQYSNDPVFSNYIIFGTNGNLSHFGFDKKSKEFCELDLYDDNFRKMYAKSFEIFVSEYASTITN